MRKRRQSTVKMIYNRNSIGGVLEFFEKTFRLPLETYRESGNREHWIIAIPCACVVQSFDPTFPCTEEFSKLISNRVKGKLCKFQFFTSVSG